MPGGHSIDPHPMVRLRRMASSKSPEAPAGVRPKVWAPLQVQSEALWAYPGAKGRAGACHPPTEPVPTPDGGPGIWVRGGRRMGDTVHSCGAAQVD